jgi:Xaa-Pro aminopeptidase
LRGEGLFLDSARTFVLGEPSRAAAEVYAALQAAFVSGERELKPGVPLSRIHQVVTECMHAAGFTAYARGHFGHGVGASVWSEEWPFIGADSDVLIETGMVLAFETPWYIRGLGALMIEDQFSIGGDGARPLGLSRATSCVFRSADEGSFYGQAVLAASRFGGPGF